MKRLALSALMLLLPDMAAAGHDGRNAQGASYADARVVEVVPIYEKVGHSVPHEVCQDERVTADRGGRRSVAAPVLGAIIGGTIGNAVGHHQRNRQVGAVAGAVLGGAVGYDLSRGGGDDARSGYRYEQVCRVEHEYREEERIAHYQVSFRYGGEVYTTELPYDPGATLRVRVAVTPADYGGDGRRAEQHAYNRSRQYWR